MKRVFAMMLFLVMALVGYAGNQVKGELRTEINGFQWYCYKDKEAYTIDGRNLFGTVQNIKQIRFSAADKGDEGRFIIKRKAKYVGIVSEVYTTNGELVCGGGWHLEPQRIFIEFTNPYRKVYYTKYTDTDQGIRYGICDDKELIAGTFKSYNVKGNFILYKELSEGKDIMVRFDGKEILKDYYSVIFEGNIIKVRTSDGRGLLNNFGEWIVNPKTGYNDFKTIRNQGNVYCLVKYGNSSQDHIISLEGKDILGEGFDNIEVNDEKYIKVKKDGAYGIMTFDGKKIIPISRGYTSISNYNSAKGTFTFTKKGYSGTCNAQGVEISTIRLAPTSDDIKTNGGYASAVAMNNGNTKYYKVSKGGRYGLTDSEGREVIPCEMDALESAGTGYLKYKLNGFWGLMNFTGKILIDTDRGYTSIGDYKSFNKRFAYTMTGYKGECDATGRQISKIKVETPKQNTSVVSSSSSSSSSSSDSKNNNSGNKTTTVVVEHHRDPVPVQDWVPCSVCGHNPGVCQTCVGNKTNYRGDPCISCRGTGKCHFCNGQGGRYQIVYR
jgi:hypothetical protein